MDADSDSSTAAAAAEGFRGEKGKGDVKGTQQGAGKVKVVGGFTHVFVERESRRPSPGGMEEGVRRGLERLLVKEKGGGLGGEKAKL